MKRTVTQQETEELFTVCENNGVHQYDVQIELVDHLASLIEEYWTVEPDAPFKYAKYRAWKKFGPTGFTKLKSEKQRALAQKNRRIIWNYLVDFYRWPKLVLTITLSLGGFLVLKTVNQLHWVFALYILILCAGAVIYNLRYKTKHKIEVLSGKSFLLTEQLQQTQLAASLIYTVPNLAYLPFTLMRTSEISMPANNIILFLVSLITVSLTIILYAYFFVIPEKIKLHFMEQFPEFVK